MEPEYIGYPLEVFIIVALIGVALIIYRPRWAFLFIVFGLAVRHYHMAVFTRNPLSGEFLNLNDLFLWIGVLAMVRNAWQGQKIWIPKILIAIIGILLVGSFQSLFEYGFIKEVMQSIWASCVSPIMFLVAVNMVKDNEDARLFYWALFLGSLGAALQHLIFIQTEIILNETGVGGSQIRTISFIFSGGIFLVIGAFFIDVRKIFRKYYVLAFWVIGLSFIGISYVLSFTRTIWVGAVMAGCALFLLIYREMGKILSKLGYAGVLLIIIFLVFRVTNLFLASDVNLSSSVEERTEFIQDEAIFEQAYQTRESGMETELGLWQDSGFIWGVGACYPPSLAGSSLIGTGALNHVAYSAYLAHFGLIGLITYGLLLPYFTIKVGKRYYFENEYNYGGVIAITAIALAFFDVFTLLSSNHYLGATGQVQGLIYGALWGLSRLLNADTAKNSKGKMIVLRPRQQWPARPISQ